jgi:hypothetical protein
MEEQTEGLFSEVSCAVQAPAEHPLRLSRAVEDEAPAAQ